MKRRQNFGPVWEQFHLLDHYTDNNQRAGAGCTCQVWIQDTKTSGRS